MAAWAGAFAGDAGAVVLRTPSGHFLGVLPKAGVSPSAISGTRPSPRAPRSSATPGVLDYQGGIVLHSSAPYLIFWDPSGNGIASASRALLSQYLADVAADSGKATNVYAVNRQFTDGSGIADYRQAFGAGQTIVDAQPYPPRDPVNCPDIATSYPNCLTDGQLQAELSRLIGADQLPTGTGASAPIYFIVTPGDTNVCLDASDCLDSPTGGFCAYHGDYTASSRTVLYASIPLFFDGASPSQDPKACQYDGHAAVQEPNGDIADVAIKYLSHELSETITDPTGQGWWDSASGNEDGDNCNYYGSTADPANGVSPDAFAPTLGGDAAAGTLYDQSINGHRYYTQSEWSNGDVGCELQPAAGTITPAFSAPGSARAGSAVSFDPSASTSTPHAFSSASWDFGDGSGSFSAGSPAAVSHTFSGQGTYTVTLTLVDRSGNLASVSHRILVGPIPTAAFSYSPGAPAAGEPIRFSGSGSSDPNRDATITAYSWDFGDGSPPGSGASPSHTYLSPGRYTVTLTITDSLGYFDSSSGTVTVAADELPTARLAVLTTRPEAGIPVAFGGAGSSDPDGSITRLSWSFGDGSAAALGGSATHVYTRAGRYTVVLTVQDSSGGAASASKAITVAAPAVSASVRGRWLRVRVDQPGTVTLGGRRKELTAPGVVSFRIALSREERRRLRAHHRLKLRLKVGFTPRAAARVSETLKIELRG